MMDNFSRIILQKPTIMKASSTNNHFRGVTPLKVHVKFDFTLFEGQIDINALEKWLNLLEGYFFVHTFSNSENITFALLKALPHVIDLWET
jgi:hypothetical protein